MVADDHTLEIARRIFTAEIDAIDRACSRFRSDSELTHVNAAGGRPTVVSDRFLEALDVALRATRLTEGLVDPTVGTAIRKLGYDRDFATIDRNGPPLLVSVHRVPGWQTIEVNAHRSTVHVPPGVELDFGSDGESAVRRPCRDRDHARPSRACW